MKNSDDEKLFQANDYQEEVIDLRKCWNVVRQHRLSIVFLTLLAVIVATLVAFSIEPTYRSTVSMLIETESPKVVSIEEVYSGNRQSAEFLNTQFEVLKSQSLARRVIDALELTVHPYFVVAEDDDFSLSSTLLKALPDALTAWFEPYSVDSDNGRQEFNPQELKLRSLVSKLSAMMSVSPVRNTQMVNISFEAKDNRLAALLANSFARIYIEYQMATRLDMTSDANSWLSQRLSTIREKLRASETALQAFKEKEKLIEAGGVTGLISKQLEKLNQDLIAARSTLSSLEAAHRQIKQVRSDDYQDYFSIPVVLRDDLVSQLIKDQSRADQVLKSLGQRYGHKHPKIISAKASLEAVNFALEQHVLSVVKGIERQYQLALSSEASTQKMLVDTQQDLHKTNRKEHQLRILEREVAANRQLYDLFLNRIKETTESTNINQTPARVIDDARPSFVPIKPRKRLIVIIAGFLGLGFGILMAFIFELLDNTMKSVADVEERVGLPMLGALPKIPGNSENLWKMVLFDNRSSYAEGIRSIRTGVVLSRLDQPHKTIMVASSMPGEGKTTISANIAIGLSEMSKVLLIDADIRKPSVGRLFGLKQDANGVTELLAKQAESNSCIHRWQGSNLFVMPSGRASANLLNVISSTAFKQLIETLSGVFDHVVIDSPPVLPVSDSRLIARMVSGVIFVMKADSTPVPLITDALRRLKQAEANILGGVLNQYDAQKHDQYGYYGYSDGYHAGDYNERTQS